MATIFLLSRLKDILKQYIEVLTHFYICFTSGDIPTKINELSDILPG